MIIDEWRFIVQGGPNK